MKKIITYSGVRLSNPNLPVVSVSAEDRLLATVPDHIGWIEATASTPAAIAGMTDRASGVILEKSDTGSASWAKGLSANGKPAIICPDGSHAAYFPNWAAADAADYPRFNVNAWTAILVFSKSATDANLNELIAGIGAGVAGVLVPRMGIGGPNSDFRLYEGTSTIRGAFSMPAAGTEVCVVVSSSVANGITMRKNGVQMYRNAADVRPLSDGRYKYGSQNSTNANVNNFSGKMMRMHIINRDLCAPENARFLSIFEQTLMNFYGIGA